MTTSYITIVGPSDLIAGLVEAQQRLGYAASEPVSSDSPADILNSPIGADEVQYAMELVTVAFTAAGSVAAFASKVIELMKEFRSLKPKVELYDQSGRKRTSIDDSSNEDDVQKAIED